MTNQLTRPAVRDDIPALRHVVDATGLFPGEMLPGLMAPFLDDTSDAFWLTCLANDLAVGLCFVEPEDLADGTWNMRALAVHPAQQAQGLGAALVIAAEQRLAAENQRILIVDTSGTEAFARTRAFYLQIGYEEEARIRDFWAEGDDKVIFRKAL
ncbi:MAG: GNAT family N-acetyltransferase [Pseudomonadota bacterium]